MSAALHNRLRRVEKVWEARTEGQLQQVRRAALASLSDGDLRQLEGGDSLADRDPAVGRFRQAFDAAAMRLSGQSHGCGIEGLAIPANRRIAIGQGIPTFKLAEVPIAQGRERRPADLLELALGTGFPDLLHPSQSVMQRGAHRIVPSLSPCSPAPQCYLQGHASRSTYARTPGLWLRARPDPCRCRLSPVPGGQSETRLGRRRRHGSPASPASAAFPGAADKTCPCIVSWQNGPPPWPSRSPGA